MLLRLDQVVFPLRPELAFGRAAPLLVEVGFGDGRFAASVARERPHWNVLGIESSAGSIQRALRRLRRESVPNVRLVHGEATFLLRQLLAPHSVSELVFNFPDPWPKSRHEDKRLLRASFFARVATRLIDGGVVSLTTDDAATWASARAEANASGLFRVEDREPPELHVTTKYALKWKEAGRRFHHSVFVKIAEASEPWPVLARGPMPHALMKGVLPSIDSFEKRVLELERGTAAVLEAYRGLDRSSLVFLVHVDEPEIVQQILIEARSTPRGIHVGLASFGQPIATPGVHAAVAWAIEWLESRGLEVVERWYRNGAVGAGERQSVRPAS